jgi:hypothetical protein
MKGKNLKRNQPSQTKWDKNKWMKYPTKQSMNQGEIHEMKKWNWRANHKSTIIQNQAKTARMVE